MFAAEVGKLYNACGQRPRSWEHVDPGSTSTDCSCDVITDMLHRLARWPESISYLSLSVSLFRAYSKFCSNKSEHDGNAGTCVPERSCTHVLLTIQGYGASHLALVIGTSIANSAA